LYIAVIQKDYDWIFHLFGIGVLRYIHILTSVAVVYPLFFCIIGFLLTQGRKVIVEVRDIFDHEVLFIDLGSTVTLSYICTNENLQWHVLEDKTNNKVELTARHDGTASNVKLKVDEKFIFGRYVVVDSNQEYSANIPYRLGNRLDV